jgi:hypothetical protein
MVSVAEEYGIEFAQPVSTERPDPLAHDYGTTYLAPAITEDPLLSSDQWHVRFAGRQNGTMDSISAAVIASGYEASMLAERFGSHTGGLGSRAKGLASRAIAELESEGFDATSLRRARNGRMHSARGRNKSAFPALDLEPVH